MQTEDYTIWNSYLLSDIGLPPPPPKKKKNK